MKYVTDLKDIPKTQHYGVLAPKSVYVPEQGDGYEAHTVHAWNYIVFDSKEEWISYIERETRFTQNRIDQTFVAVGVVPAAVSVEVSVNIQ